MPEEPAFYDMLPDIREVFAKLPKIENEATMRKLMDHGSWLYVYMEHPNLLTDPVITPMPVPAPEYITPLEVMRSLTLAERQRLYSAYIDRFIPTIEQIKLGIGGASVTPAERLRRITDPDNQKLINAVLAGIFGLQTPADPDPAKDRVPIWDRGLTVAQRGKAKSSIDASLQHYFKNPLIRPDPMSTVLAKDVRTAVEGSTLPRMRDVVTSPTLLERYVKASPLKGALQQGMVTEADLKEVFAMNQAEEQDFLDTVHAVRGELDTLTEATKMQNQIEANGILRRIGSMNGAEKLLLAAAGLFLLTRRGGVGTFFRGAAVFFTGVYFYQKLFLKQDDPMKFWDQQLGKGHDLVMGINGKLPGSEKMPGDTAGITDRAHSMVRFLNEFDRQNANTMATGFALIADTPLRVLAHHFEMGPDGKAWTLGIEDPELDKQLRESMKKNRWSTRAYQSFFHDGTGENRAQVTEALGFVFYLLAKRDPANDVDARTVDKVRAKLPLGATMARTGDLHEGPYDYNKTNPQFQGEMLEGNDAYIRLVRKGRAIAKATNMSLKDIIAQSLESQVLVTERSSYEGSPNPPDVVAVGVPAPDVPPVGVPAPDVPPVGAPAPDIPPVGVPAPDVPAAGVPAPDVPGAGGAAPDIPPAGVGAPDAPPAGVDVPDVPAAGGAAPDIPRAGVGAPDAPAAGVDIPDVPGAGADVPDVPRAGVDPPDVPPVRVDAPDAPGAGRAGPDEPGVGGGGPDIPHGGARAPHVASGGRPGPDVPVAGGGAAPLAPAPGRDAADVPTGGIGAPAVSPRGRATGPDVLAAGSASGAGRSSVDVPRTGRASTDVPRSGESAIDSAPSGTSAPRSGAPARAGAAPTTPGADTASPEEATRGAERASSAAPAGTPSVTDATRGTRTPRGAGRTGTAAPDVPGD